MLHKAVLLITKDPHRLSMSRVASLSIIGAMPEVTYSHNSFKNCWFICQTCDMKRSTNAKLILRWLAILERSKSVFSRVPKTGFWLSKTPRPVDFPGPTDLGTLWNFCWPLHTSRMMRTSTWPEITFIPGSREKSALRNLANQTSFSSNAPLALCKSGYGLISRVDAESSRNSVRNKLQPENYELLVVGV